MFNDIEVSGATASSGRQYLIFHHDGKTGILPREAATIGNKHFHDELARAGFPIVDKKHMNYLLERIRPMKEFPDAPIIEQIGWNGDAFVLADGTVIPESAQDAYLLALPNKIGVCSASGDMVTWRSEVAAPMAGQPVAEFAMMLPFVAPSMHFMPSAPSITLEMVGDPGCLKSRLLRIASSACGDPNDGSGRAWETLRPVVEQLDQVRTRHRDQTIIIDETNAYLAMADKKTIARTYRTVAHNLAGAMVRDGTGAVSSSRTVAIIAADVSLRTIADQKGQSDNLITLQIPQWEKGVFEGLPNDGPSAAVHAETLFQAALGQHGHALRRFVFKMMEDVKMRGETWLVAHVDAHQRKFLAAIDVDRNKGDDYRAARVFAAIYAAGRYAQKKKILPSAFDCMASVSACYGLYLSGNAAPLPFGERLEVLIQSGHIVVITKGQDPAHQKALAEQAIGILNVGSTHREVRIPPKNILRAFPDWHRLQKEPEVLALLNKDGRNLRTKARLTPDGERQRMFCFRLPLRDEEGTLFDNVEGD